jgi:integrase
MLFETQSTVFMREIQTRRRQPVRASTARIYESYLNSRILPLLGRLDLNVIENGAAKQFISGLNETDLSAGTINDIFKVVKAVIASAVDLNGNEMYPRKWNHDFIDLPIVEKTDRFTPTVTPKKVTEAVRSASSRDRALFTLLAASGLRVGEALALKAGSDDGLNSFYDSREGILHIRTTLVSGKVQNSPKTAAGIRQVDLSPDVNQYLQRAGLPTDGFLFQNRQGGTVKMRSAYDRLRKAGITEGFHSFRRFRITHLEAQSVPRGLAMYWTGHAEKDVHGSYIKIGQDLQTRRDWAKRAGIGFELA